jgi:biotin transporter BioY
MITGHWPFGRNESGIPGFIGVVGGYLLAWIIDGLLNKNKKNDLEE